jgi:hypothetical protein
MYVGGGEELWKCVGGSSGWKGVKEPPNKYGSSSTSMCATIL